MRTRVWTLLKAYDVRSIIINYYLMRWVFFLMLKSQIKIIYSVDY